MKKSTIIEIAKFAGALTIGGAIGAAAVPSIKNLFKMNKKEEPEIETEDIEEEDIESEE